MLLKGKEQNGRSTLPPKEYRSFRSEREKKCHTTVLTQTFIVSEGYAMHARICSASRVRHARVDVY